MNRIFSLLWLVSLVVFSRLPVVSYASDHATSPIEQSQSSGESSQLSSINNSSLSKLSLQAIQTSSAPAIHFDCLSASEGLSFSLVNSIIQDQRGFMWFGTRYGLDKYDGFNFSFYTFETGENFLNDNYILELFQDRTGNIWFSTYSDLVRRDSETGNFFHFKYGTDDSRGIGPGIVTTIVEDQQGILWVGTTQGLNRYEPVTGTFTQVLQNQGVGSYYVDRQGGIWLGTASGLWKYPLGQPGQQEPEIIQYISPDTGDRVDISYANAIYEDHQGMLWVGSSSEGLYQLDPSTGKITRFQHNPDNPDSLSDNRVITILEDHLHRLWIGTYDGLNLMDRNTSRFYRYQYNPEDPYSLNSNLVNHIYEDRSGVVWIATQGGICKVNELASLFTHYQQGPGLQVGESGERPGYLPVLSDNQVTAIYLDRQGILWIGTHLGLNQLDLSSGRMTVYKNDPEDPTSLGYGEVGVIYEDRSGTLWVGTIGGLDRFNPETGTFSAVEAFRWQSVFAILEDQQGGLWIGGWGGVARREPGAASFTPLETGSALSASEPVQALHIDRYGTVWISTQAKGLFRLYPGEKGGTTPGLVHFPRETANPSSPGISPVVSFYEDRQGTLWMGSVDDGLVRFIPDNQTFMHYLPSTGIVRYVGCIQGDAQGYLWMGTALGLARFDPRTETFTYFDARDGLEIGLGVDCIQNEQGEMFFTSLNGVNRFFPEQISTNPKPPEVVITSLNLFSQPFRTDLNAGEAIELAYNKNYLSFDFAALDFTVPAKNQYAYKMDGLDPDWIEAGTRRHADYPDLKPGSYTFRVKASNNSGVWNEQGTAVQITIAPPFWQTWWFLSVVGLALVGGTLGGLRLRVRSLEARSRELEKQVHDRTSALEQKTLELQQQTQETEQRRQELEALLVENTRLSKQSQELAVLEERNRLARDLHDSITQSIYGVTLYAEVATQLLKSGEVEKASTHLQELKAMALDSLAEMRLMIYELRPSVFEQEGLVAAIQARLDAVEGRVGLKTNFTIRGEISLTPQLEAGLYRIAQEALNNVLKHAHASHVSITLAQDAQSIYMEIADDGVGFDPLQEREAGCLGLRNMQERAQELGITFEILSQAGKGTKIILKRPLP